MVLREKLWSWSWWPPQSNNVVKKCLKSRKWPISRILGLLWWTAPVVKCQYGWKSVSRSTRALLPCGLKDFILFRKISEMWPFNNSVRKIILNANEMVIFWRILKSFGSHVATFKNYHRPNFQPPSMFVVGIVCQNVRFFAKFWPFSEPNFEFSESHKKNFMGANKHYFIHILRLFHFCPGQINFILVCFPLIFAGHLFWRFFWQPKIRKNWFRQTKISILVQKRGAAFGRIGTRCPSFSLKQNLSISEQMVWTYNT